MGFAGDNRFVLLEDTRLQEDNTENLRNIFTQEYGWPQKASGLYRPLTTLSYWFNYSVLAHRDVAVGYVVINLLLHCAVACLAFGVMLLLTQNRWPSFFTAAWFAIHPVNTESVANIIGRAEVLAGLAVLGGLLLHAKASAVSQPSRLSRWLPWLMGILFVASAGWFLWARVSLPWGWSVGGLAGMTLASLAVAGSLSGWRVVGWLTGLTGLTCLGLFCSENAVVVVGIILLYDLMFRWEKRHRNFWRNLAEWGWRGFWRRYSVLVAPLLAVSTVRQWVMDHSRLPEVSFLENPLVKFQEHFGSVFHSDFWLARLTAIQVMGRYLQLLLWPKNLSCDYSYHQISLVQWPMRGDGDWAALRTLCLLAILALVAARQFRRSKPAVFLVAFSFLAFLPSSNLWTMTGSLQAERFLYLPSLGFVGAMVLVIYASWRWGIDRFRATSFGTQLRFRTWALPMQAPVPARVMLFLVLIVCGARTFARTLDWKNDITLWTSAVETSPQSIKAHRSLAFALYEQNPDLRVGGHRIIPEAEKAAEIMMAEELPLKWQSRLLPKQLGSYYRIRANWFASIATEDRADLQEQAHYWFERARAAFDHAANLDRAFNTDVHSRELKRPRGLPVLQELGDPTIYANLGLVYLGLHQYVKALQAFQFQRLADPSSADACQNMAAVYAAMGDKDQVMIHLLQSLILEPHRYPVIETAINLYRQMDTVGCALQQNARQVVMNARCPMVRDHLCSAYAGIVHSFTAARQPDAAARYQRMAIQNHQCPAERFPTFQVR